MKKIYTCLLLGIVLLTGCASPRFLVKYKECAEDAGDYKICQQAQVIKIK